MKENPGRLISLLYRKSQIFWTHILKEHHITSAEYPILIVLNKKDGITQEEIATKLGLDKSAVARLMKSLMEKDFIERKKDQEDLRCNKVYLTEKGHSSWQPIKNGMDEWHKIIAKDIKAEEVSEVVRILSQMADNALDYLEKH